MYKFCYNHIFLFLDCHAEIISRRCLLEFLYKQIEQFENGKPKPYSIFEPKISQGITIGYKLKVIFIIETLFSAVMHPTTFSVTNFNIV